MKTFDRCKNYTNLLKPSEVNLKKNSDNALDTQERYCGRYTRTLCEFVASNVARKMVGNTSIRPIQFVCNFIH